MKYGTDSAVIWAGSLAEKKCLAVKSRLEATGLPVLIVNSSVGHHDDIFHSAKRIGEWQRDFGLMRPALVLAGSEIPAELRGVFFQNVLNADSSELVSSIFSKSMIIAPEQARILVLYDQLSTHVQTIYDHLSAFKRYSNHEISYCACTVNSPLNFNLGDYDIIVVHFSVRLSLPDYISSEFADALSKYPGRKILFIQDEFDTTEVARSWMDRLRFHTVYTIIPQLSVETVYPQDRFSRTEFITTLAGFVPEQHGNEPKIVPFTQRPIEIGYRGRDLPYWYGALGQEKKQIGVKMKEACQQRGIVEDIQWDDRYRIYGIAWFEFLSQCKAMIGCEGGSNILDEYGAIRSAIESALKVEPNLSFEKAYQLFLLPHENRIRTNQITPKFFEAIYFKTALVLYEGEYSGVLQPHRHYIPLKKDFSNVDDVFRQLTNLPEIQEMVDRTYAEIVSSGLYSHSNFIRNFDRYIDHSRDASITFAARSSMSRSSHTSNPPCRNLPTMMPLTVAQISEGEEPYV